MEQKPTYKGIFDEVDADYEKIQIKIRILHKRVSKEFKKDLLYPSFRWFDYTIPSTNNQYILYFWCMNKNCDPSGDYFRVYPFGQQLFILRCYRGGFQCTENGPREIIPQVHVYTTHFFERYKERFLHRNDLRLFDVACRFFARNRIVIPIKINEHINRNIDAYGPNSKVGFRVNDGFCFTMHDIDGKKDLSGNMDLDEIESMLFVYTSFVNKELLSQEQKEAIDKEHQNVITNFFNLTHTKTINDTP